MKDLFDNVVGYGNHVVIRKLGRIKMTAETEANRWRNGQKSSDFNEPAEQFTIVDVTHDNNGIPQGIADAKKAAVAKGHTDAWFKSISKGHSPAG